MSKRNKSKRRQVNNLPKQPALVATPPLPLPAVLPAPQPTASVSGNLTKSNKSRSWTDRLVALAAVVGIFLAAWQGWETRRQYDAMIESNRIVTESSQTELRAYIHPVTELRPLLSYSRKDGEFSFVIKLRNSGSTPAKNATARIATFFLPADDETGPAPESAEQVNGPKMTVGPGQEWTLGTTLPLEDDERILQESEEYVAWVVGKVEYEDVFGHKAFTTFRFQQGPAFKSDDNEVSKFDMLIIGIESERLPE